MPVGFAYVSGDVTEAILTGDVTVSFVNEYTTGSLTIEKIVTGTHAPKDSNGNYSDEFEFTIELTNAPAGEYGQFTFEKLKDDASTPDVDESATRNSVFATTTLTGGQSIEIADLPDGASYIVTENEHDDYVTTKTGDTGTIDADAVTAAKATFTNAYKEGKLTITKTGMSSGENAIFNVKQGSSVVRQVVVPNGQSVTLLLPAGDYTVEEVGTWTGRYESTITVDNFDDKIEHGDEDSLTYNNTSKNDKWLTDESIKSNEFKPEGGDQ